ncbi:MAG: aconitate hydratase AcnA [Desulfuromonadaceae bacterium]
MPLNTFASSTTLKVAADTYRYHSLQLAQEQGLEINPALPFSLKVLLENLLRHEDGNSVTPENIRAVAAWKPNQGLEQEIAYRPARVLMQDFTGVPAIVDLAAMRDAMAANGGDPTSINPQIPVDMVIDHSVTVDAFGSADAAHTNVTKEMERNRERYTFLRWGQKVFNNFRVVPPGTGICHQVNLEYLGRSVWNQNIDGEEWAYPDTLVGTDSHTTMINALGVLGWGVGGIEAEAAMLGQPVSMLIPEVVGFKFSGALQPGVTATDLVLTVTRMLREHGVVGKFVEFCGTGLSQLPLADRATIANMAPEYGATCGFFPVDSITLDYLHLSGRSDTTIDLVEAYCKDQGLWRDDTTPEPEFSAALELDLSTVEPSLAGPRRPQDQVPLDQLRKVQETELPSASAKTDNRSTDTRKLQDGDVVIAAITSCTNTSNPAVMLTAGLLAQKAVGRGLQTKPWVKTSLAPGSRVVSAYLEKAGVQQSLDQLGFDLVGYGCTTCIGNSGPLPPEVEEAITSDDLQVSAVLSGNRNFEGRVHPLTRFNWLASPPLVVAFALAGTTRIDLSSEPLGTDSKGDAVYLADIWPTMDEIHALEQNVTPAMFQRHYAEVFDGDEEWQALPVPEGMTYTWDKNSTYIRQPAFFDKLERRAGFAGLDEARILALLGDSITTDHISPAGAIKKESPAGEYLHAHGIEAQNFNSYGSRRGNHEVMVRGTFANIRLKNRMVPGIEGGVTLHQPDGTQMSIYAAAQEYQRANVPLVVIAGEQYGTGSSRDWAAKGTLLLGVKAVLAQSFERIHRSNLVGMGILPIQFLPGESAESLGLDGSETLHMNPVQNIEPKQKMGLKIHHPNTGTRHIEVICRVDTYQEVVFFNSGGILNHVLLERLGSVSE